jgi:hypothetical protein
MRSSSLYLILIFADLQSQRPIDPLLVSTSLRSPAAKEWLAAIGPSEHEIEEIFQILSPNIRFAARQAMHTLRQGQDQALATAATNWSSSFTGISVIANRATPAHIDAFGHHCWYDLLLAAGTYHQSSFNLPDLGIQMDYPPGTLIALTGKFIRHEVLDWDQGDRVCYAHFMRKAVLDRLQTSVPDWTTMEEFYALFT